jgi:hypothetical protein
MEEPMKATFVLEASRPDGSLYRVELSLGLFALGWLARYFGT